MQSHKCLSPEGISWPVLKIRKISYYQISFDMRHHLTGTQSVTWVFYLYIATCRLLTTSRPATPHNPFLKKVSYFRQDGFVDDTYVLSNGAYS